MKWLADENFNRNIVREIVRRQPSIDIVRVQDLGLTGAMDEEVLAAAANAGRILLTQDVNTLVALAYQRFHSGSPVPGVLVCPADLGIRQTIDDLLLLDACGRESDFRSVVVYLPLR